MIAEMSQFFQLSVSSSSCNYTYVQLIPVPVCFIFYYNTIRYKLFHFSYIGVYRV